MVRTRRLSLYVEGSDYPLLAWTIDANLVPVLNAYAGRSCTTRFVTLEVIFRECALDHLALG